MDIQQIANHVWSVGYKVRQEGKFRKDRKGSRRQVTVGLECYAEEFGMYPVGIRKPESSLTW